MAQPQRISIVIPALNEAPSLQTLLPSLRETFPDAEIIVVDDGSMDATAATCAANLCTLVANPYRMGNGAAIKRGTRAAHGETIVFMDGDGQHTAEHVRQLLARFEVEDLDMLVGARRGQHHAGLLRRFGNACFNQLASWMTGRRIPDLTSGLRVVRAARFREFLHLLPNGYSYPTTSTMAFLRSAYSVDYAYIDVRPRMGRSHLKVWKEGSRFILIIFKIGAMYSPMKLFLPISIGLFLIATGLYSFTYLTVGRFTNMSALLYMTSLLTFLIGVVSEQITGLMFARRERDHT